MSSSDPIPSVPSSVPSSAGSVGHIRGGEGLSTTLTQIQQQQAKAAQNAPSGIQPYSSSTGDSIAPASGNSADDFGGGANQRPLPPNSGGFV